jgi:hypothetical protein
MEALLLLLHPTKKEEWFGPILPKKVMTLLQCPVASFELLTRPFTNPRLAPGFSLK